MASSDKITDDMDLLQIQNYISQNIHNLNEYQQKFIFESVIKEKSDTLYSLNNNGCFMKFSDIDEKNIIEIYKLVKSVQETDNIVETEREDIINDFKKQLTVSEPENLNNIDNVTAEFSEINLNKENKKNKEFPDIEEVEKLMLQHMKPKKYKKDSVFYRIDKKIRKRNTTYSPRQMIFSATKMIDSVDEQVISPLIPDEDIIPFPEDIEEDELDDYQSDEDTQESKKITYDLNEPVLLAEDYV